MRYGDIQVPSTVNPPSENNGVYYYDSDLNKFQFRENGAWVGLGGGGGGTLAQTLALGNGTNGHDIYFTTDGDVILDVSIVSIDPYNRKLHNSSGEQTMNWNLSGGGIGSTLYGYVDLVVNSSSQLGFYGTDGTGKYFSTFGAAATAGVGYFYDNNFGVTLASTSSSYAGSFTDSTNTTVICDGVQAANFTDGTYTVELVRAEYGRAAHFQDSVRYVNICDGVNAMYVSGGPVTYVPISTPGTPMMGDICLYFKSDEKLYKMGGDGVEKAIGADLTVLSIDNTDSPYTIQSADQVFFVDASANDVTINFPLASTRPGRVITVKLLAQAGTGVYLYPSGMDAIEDSGATIPYYMTQTLRSVQVVSNGVDHWWFIGENT